MSVLKENIHLTVKLFIRYVRLYKLLRLHITVRPGPFKKKIRNKI